MPSTIPIENPTYNNAIKINIKNKNTKINNIDFIKY